MPLEWTVPHREENACYAKLVCNKAENVSLFLKEIKTFQGDQGMIQWYDVWLLDGHKSCWIKESVNKDRASATWNDEVLLINKLVDIQKGWQLDKVDDLKASSYKWTLLSSFTSKSQCEIV